MPCLFLQLRQLRVIFGSFSPIVLYCIYAFIQRFLQCTTIRSASSARDPERIMSLPHILIIHSLFIHYKHLYSASSSGATQKHTLVHAHINTRARAQTHVIYSASLSTLSCTMFNVITNHNIACISSQQCHKPALTACSLVV